MPLTMRAGFGRGAKLSALFIAVNLTACSLTLRDVPRAGVNEVREYLGSASRGAAVREVVDSAPELVWRADAGRGSLGAVAMGERITVVATVDRRVYALDTRTGRVFWQYRGDNPYRVGPVMTEQLVVVGSEGPSGRLTAVRMASGKRAWQARVGDVSAPITIRDSTVYGATSSGTVFAHALRDGRRRWSRPVGPTRSGPLVAGGLLIVVTSSDTMVVLDAADGEERSRVALPTTTVAPLALLDDSTAVMTSPAGAVLALAIPTGGVRWRVDTGDPIFGAPVVGADTVFALTNRCTLWTIPAGGNVTPDTVSIGCVTVAAPGLVRGGVLVATVDGSLVYFDRADRRRRWVREADGELRHPPMVRHGQMVIAPVIGDVVSYR
jgi:outer membrane protein assembly factor BamB